MKGIKTGGRVQGTPNQKTAELKTWVKNLLESNQNVFEKDLQAIKDPKDRLQVMTSLLKFVIAPATQPLDPEIAIQLEYIELDKLLNSMPDIAVEKLAQKILTLKQKEDETQGKHND